MIITIRTTMMTVTTNDNTNTYTNAGDHEWQTAGLKIHHVSSPWHDCHVTTSQLDVSPPLPSPSPHTLAFMSEQLFLIPESISSTSQQTTLTMTVYSLLTLSHCLSIAPTTTPTSYLNGKVPHLFFFIFFLLIILSIRSTATTPPHHHYQYLQSTPNHIGLRRVCISSLRSFFFFHILY